jgi:hypothetical protein
LEEDHRRNKALEESIKYSNNDVTYNADGLYLSPNSPEWKNYGMSIDVKDFINNTKLDPVGKRSLRNILKNLSSYFRIKKQGNGIHLSPIE